MASLNPYLVIYIFCHLTLETEEGKKIINHAIIVVLKKLWDFRGTSVLPSQLFIECHDFWEKWFEIVWTGCDAHERGMKNENQKFV